MTHAESQTKLEHEPTNELLDDNARKFIVESFDDSILQAASAQYLLVTDWLEMGAENEKKLAYKKYSNGDVQILLISKHTDKQGRTSVKDKIDAEVYEKLLSGSVRHIEKIRYELNTTQGDVDFELKYDEFEDSSLRILEVDAKTDEERAVFDTESFPARLTEVTGDIRYYGYRVGDVLAGAPF